MSSIDQMKNDIESINSFATNFSAKTQNISEKAEEVLNKLDHIIKIEKNNESFLLALNSSLSEVELDNKIQEIKEKQQSITEKQKEYITIIENNGKNIQKIKQSLDKKQDKIKEIFDSVDNLEKSMSLINTN
jgi:methyl-accepting chemotaxis protein